MLKSRSFGTVDPAYLCFDTRGFTFFFSTFYSRDLSPGFPPWFVENISWMFSISKFSLFTGRPSPWVLKSMRNIFLTVDRCRVYPASPPKSAGIGCSTPATEIRTSATWKDGCWRYTPNKRTQWTDCEWDVLGLHIFNVVPKQKGANTGARASS